MSTYIGVYGFRRCCACLTQEELCRVLISRPDAEEVSEI